MRVTITCSLLALGSCMPVADVEGLAAVGESTPASPVLSVPLQHDPQEAARMGVQGSAPVCPLQPQAPPEEAADGPTIRGRVLDFRTGAGRAGVLVRLRNGKHTRERRTEDDGSFALVSWDAERRPSIYVKSNNLLRWITANPLGARRLTEEETAGTVELKLHIADYRTRPIHGIAVRAGTDEPLANFTFQANSQARVEGRYQRLSLVTDDHGRFRSDDVIRDGKTLISAKDPAVRFDVDLIHTDENPTRLEFPVADVIRCKLTGDVPADTQTLQFYVGSERQTQQGTAMQLQWSRQGRAMQLHASADGSFWVRPSARSALAGAPVTLAIADKRGLVLGTCRYTWGATLTEALSFEMQSTASLGVRLTVERPADAPQYEGVDRPVVDLRPLDARPGPLWDWRKGRRKWLEPGVYEVSATTRAHGSVIQRVELRAGEHTSIPVSLTLVPGSRTVHGTIRMESGAPLKSATVSLCLQDDPTAGWWASFERSRFFGTGIDHSIGIRKGSTPEVGEFTFQRVPPGEVRVTPLCSSMPSRQEVTEQEDGSLSVAVVFLDRYAGEGYGFSARSKDGPLPFYTVYAADGRRISSSSRDGAVVQIASEHSLPNRWAITSRGMLPFYGTASDFTKNAAGQHIASVVLEPGWGTCVRVHDPEGFPVQDVEVFMDGNSLGKTDEAGELRVVLESSPLQLNVERAGWHSGHDIPRRATARAWHEVTLYRDV